MWRAMIDHVLKEQYIKEISSWWRRDTKRVYKWPSYFVELTVISEQGLSVEKDCDTRYPR